MNGAFGVRLVSVDMTDEKRAPAVMDVMASERRDT
jgi:hypothetical protein